METLTLAAQRAGAGSVNGVHRARNSVGEPARVERAEIRCNRPVPTEKRGVVGGRKQAEEGAAAALCVLCSWAATPAESSSMLVLPVNAIDLTDRPVADMLMSRLGASDAPSWCRLAFGGWRTC